MATWAKGLCITLLAAAAVRADTVHDGSGAYQNVRILGIVDDELRFRMPDGRTLRMAATRLRWISVSSDRDRAADALSRAEQLRDQGRLERAVGQYRDVRRTGRVRWMRDFALMRLATSHDVLGQFPDALDAYLALAPRHPILAKAAIPRNLPALETDEGKAALAKIRAAIKRSQPADVAVALRRLQKQIETGVGNRRAASGPKPERSTGANRRSAKRSKRRTPATPQNPAQQIRDAILRGAFAEAEEYLSAGRQNAEPEDRPYWLILEAELRFAKKEFARSGLAAMRVVALHPDSPHVSAGLYWAGRCYEALGVDEKASGLYRECLGHKSINASVREAAQGRLAGLGKKAPGTDGQRAEPAP